MQLTIVVNGPLNLYLTANKQEENVSAKFDAIMRAVAEQNSVIDSVLLLVDQLASDDLSDEETASILKEMQSKKQVMADSVLRNTRAATVEPSTPTPAPGSIPGMTTGNNEGGSTPNPVSEPASPNPDAQSQPGSATPGFTPTSGTGDIPNGGSEPSSPTRTGESPA